MKRPAILVLALCASCGSGPLTNDALMGRWIASYGDGELTMELTPGDLGVSGAVTDVAGYVGSATVSTLPDRKLRWTFNNGASWDFYVNDVAYCPGEPLPSLPRLHWISLTFGQAPQSGGFFFRREGPQPGCSLPTGPP